MTFDEFKELLEFRESEDSRFQIHYFHARLQAQAKHGVAQEAFNMDQEGVREYFHNALAHKIWDLCMQAFGPTGPTYTVDDLRKAHEMGEYGCSFERALKVIEDKRG